MKTNIDDFLSCLDDPDKTQLNYLLTKIINPNLECKYGIQYKFDKIHSISDYQNQVPIVSFQDISHDIEKMKNGEENILVSSPIKRFFSTSGTSSTPKNIPVTSSLIAEKSRAFGVYWDLLFKEHPQAEKGKVVGNFSDSSGSSITECGLPISSEGSFWNMLGAATQKRGKSPLPKSISLIKDSESRYYAVARILMEENVSLLMALNPSTLLVLFRKMNKNALDLINDIENGGIKESIDIDQEVRDYIKEKYTGNKDRAKQLRSLIKNSEIPLPANLVWENMKMIISWRSPMQQSYIRLLEPHIGNIPQRDYLLMASEGVIAIPVEDNVSGGVLATSFNFYEFIHENDIENTSPRILLASQLEKGSCYLVIISTSSGLYRYNIGDIVRVTGHKGNTPTLEFLYRSGSTCSITGEKLTEEQVVKAINTTCTTLGITIEDFTLQPSDKGFPHYLLIMEPTTTLSTEMQESFISVFDLALARINIEYQAKRDSARLEAPEIYIVKNGSYANLRKSKIHLGANDGQIKPIKLTRDTKFLSNISSIS